MVPRGRGRGRRKDAGGRGLTRLAHPRRRERRCIATGASRPPAELIRFAVDASGAVIPDAAGLLPGRGIWVTADRGAIERAVGRNLFARSARRAVKVPDDLAARAERAVAQHLAIVSERLRRNGLAAADDAAVSNTVPVAPGRTLDAVRAVAWASSEMSLAALGQNVVHAGPAPSSLFEQFLRHAQRLRGLRGGSAVVPSGGDHQRSAESRVPAPVDMHAVGLPKGLT